MARFRAYASDSSSDEEELQRAGTSSASERLPDQQGRDEQHESESDEESLSNSGESSSSSSSDMDEDELIAPRTLKSLNSRGRNALVEDRDGEIRYAHELDVRVSPPSARSSPPSNPRQHVNGNPTIIPWAQQIGVDAQKMHVMQTSLFRMPEAAALRALDQPTRPQQTARQNLVLPAQSLNRKHSRDSDGDGLRFDSRERASFAHDIEPPIYRPSRKYARVEINSSIANGKEGIYVDAGLAMGRSFRVGWGPGGTLLHLGSICGPLSTSGISANSSVITLTKILPPPPIAGSSSALASKLLQHHLSHTPISPDDAGIPFAYPSPSPSSSSSFSSSEPSSSNPLSFDSFASLFPTTDSSSPAALFRLGSALFDPLNLHLSRQPRGSDTTTGTAITPDLRNRITLLRRKTALSKWLEDSVKQSIDRDLRAKAHGTSSATTYTPADIAFTHLTGHQVEQACNAAADGGYLKLSTLISQSGGDAIFKDDVRSQLEIWKNEKLTPGMGGLGGIQNALVGKGVWKVYRLLGGLIDDEPDAAGKGDDLCAGLDWKRVFGLYLWYGTDVDATIADVVRAYEPATQTGAARPLPTWTLEGKHPQSTFSSVGTSGTSRLGTSFSSASRAKEPDDPLFALIKLHADPALSLSHILDPLSFAPSGLDWGIGMCWHLYVILSRVMRVRDFVDRGDPGVRSSRKRKTNNGLVNGWGSSGGESSEEEGEEDGDVEGHSPTADLLASSYAFELESWGMIQEAIFVLLHVEGSVGREKAIKALLARSAPKFDEWMTRGIVGSLKIPMAWVDEAKAIYALNQGDIFRAYELYTAAGLFNLAHDLAVLELAPDAVIRRDLDLLKSLFLPFDRDGRRDKIDNWFVRGKVFLDYVHIMTRLPELYDQLAEESGRQGAIPDATQQDEIEDLSRRVPRLIGILPDVLHRSRKIDDRHPAALEEMVKGLLGVVERANPLILAQIQQLGTVDGVAKIRLVRGMGFTRFLRSVGA